MLAKLETDGSVSRRPVGQSDKEIEGNGGSTRCKRKLANDRVFVIPHHHQIALGASTFRRPVKDNFTLGIQGRGKCRLDETCTMFEPSAASSNGAKQRPRIQISSIKAKTNEDIVQTQRGWDMSVSWNKACEIGVNIFENTKAAAACRAMLSCKSGQRFVNALALGVPALGFAGYPAIQDACQGSELCLTTFEAAAAKRTVLDLAADDARYRRYRESAARLSRAYHPYRIARRYAAMARALLARAEDVHRSPIVDTAECRAREDWAASGEVGPTGGARGIEEYFAARRPAGREAGGR